MFRNRQNHIVTTISASLLVTLCSTGCRSGMMPRMNMFGMRSEPSAEALAGNGPTTTYPSPPGESVSPQAIASIAAGTMGSDNDPITSPIKIDNGTAQVAGMDISSGYVSPASSNVPTTKMPTTNMAAAQANGIFNEKTPSYVKNNAIPTGPSGYQYGSKSTSPTSVAAATMPSPSKASTYTQPASMTPPATYTAPTTTPAQSGGFTMPDNLAPSVAANVPQMREPAPVMLPATIPAAAPQPEHRIATSDIDSMIPAIDIGAPTSAPSTSAGGYMPGSTAGAVSYPTGGYSKPDTTGGSFYR